MVYIRFHNPVWNVHFAAQILNRSQIKIIKAQVYCDGAQFKFLRIKTFQTVKGIKQCKAVFSAGNSRNIKDMAGS